jgi:hypothetical protein
MKPFIIVCAMLAAFAFPRFAAAQATHQEDSKVTELHLSEAMVVGNTTLKPGDYRFQCKHVDGEQFLVVTSDVDRKEVARVPCTAENLPEKVKVSEFRSRSVADGSKVLSSVRIKGETIAHRVLN